MYWLSTFYCGEMDERLAKTAKAGLARSRCREKDKLLNETEALIPPIDGLQLCSKNRNGSKPTR